ncbi:MAG: hypothetical protein RLZZ293_103 [Pseudomonadota bacterium]|jgi:ferrous iron transport protein A
MNQQQFIPLSQLRIGQSGIVQKVDAELLPHNIDLEANELEQRILEIGIIEGVKIKVLHFGLIKRDPLAIQIADNTTLAIRRNEASMILVKVSQ